jgi:STE24 endopeptidase
VAVFGTLLVIALLLLTGLSVRLRELAGGSAAVYVLFAAVLHEAVGLPVAWYRSYVLERQYGLSLVSARAWVRDYAKAAVLALSAAMAGAELLVAAIRAWPDWWWLAAAAGSAAAVTLLTSMGPVLVLPIFHRSRPLPAGALRQRLVELSLRAGVPVLDVRVWGRGEGTQRASAGLAGAGATRRILLSHTLVAGYTGDEIEVILAHELGHHLHHDLRAALMAECAVLLAGFLGAAVALRMWWQPLGLAGPADVAGLPVIVAAVGAAGLAARPLLNALSRRSERRADRFALSIASRPEAFVPAVRRMAAQNLAEERPTRASRWLFHTHPTVDERVRQAEHTAPAGG